MEDSVPQMTLKDFDARWMPEPFSGCWLWTGMIKDSGYGRFHIRPGVEERAHRAAWEFYRGTIPKGKCVLHKCDVRACVNPDHLFIGSKFDNIRDCISKGRFQKGTLNGGAKLNESQVVAIRSSMAKCSALSRQFDVGKTTIRYIRNGKLWKHIL